MNIEIFEERRALGKAAAQQAAGAIRKAIGERGKARIVAATAGSQKEFLEELARAPDMDWRRVEAFHLDEYIGLPITHPGSFRRMLLEQLIRPTGIAQYHLLDGDGDVAEVLRVSSETVAAQAVDVAFLGIGENGHLAFNDPPADFVTEAPYVVVELDQVSRTQQVGEGWFRNVSEVPKQAISMSIRQILKARELIVVVPGANKAQAVKACFAGEVSAMAPGSILRTHPHATVYLDRESAALLDMDSNDFAASRY